MKQAGALVAVATYCEAEEDSLASGAALVRRYLDVAFGDKSKEYIPGVCCEHGPVWATVIGIFRNFEHIS